MLWSNGLVEATILTQDTVEGREVSSLPFLSEDNRDNTVAAIRQLFLNGLTGNGDEEERGSRRRMVVALVPGAPTAAGAKREILLHFTAAFFADSQHVLCLGRELEIELSSLLKDDHQDAADTVSSLTSQTFTFTSETPSSFGEPEANTKAYSDNDDESASGTWNFVRPQSEGSDSTSWTCTWVGDAHASEPDSTSNAGSSTGSSAKPPVAGGPIRSAATV